MSDRPTPETDALVPSQGRPRTMREYIEELEAHARRLERQRDEKTRIIDKLGLELYATQRQRDELLEFSRWAMEQFTGDSGTGESHWEQFPEFRAGRAAILIASLKGGSHDLRRH